MKVLYEDKANGIFNPSILVDITGDNITDIVTAMFNSCLVAINGETFQQIWNFTIPGNNSESGITPTPGYFNSDNYTDFLVIYQSSSNTSNNTSNTQVIHQFIYWYNATSRKNFGGFLIPSFSIQVKIVHSESVLRQKNCL